MSENKLLEKSKKIFEKDERIESVTFYPHGFVPNSYKWPIKRTRYVVNRGIDIVFEEYYDAKRSHGAGPSWVAFSKNGGRLMSA